jgi:hypothetical protein
MTILSDIHHCWARGFCGTHTIFWYPSSTSHYPSIPMDWISCLEVGSVFYVP